MVSVSLNRCGYVAILFALVDSLSLTSPAAHLNDSELRLRTPTHAPETDRQVDIQTEPTVEAPAGTATAKNVRVFSLLRGKSDDTPETVSSDASEHDQLVLSLQDQDKYFTAPHFS